jgi:S-adenosyl methyltransferase
MIIDFASGLPTNDHLHMKVKPGTTVIYSDYDPVVVEYTHEILKNASNTYFFQSDARKPEDLLNRPEVVKLLGGRRKVAFVVWGISLFLTDEEITHLVKYLYEWSAPGSILAFNAQGADVDTKDPDLIKVGDIYAKMGSELHFRTSSQYIKLLKPWKLEGKEFTSLLEWSGFDQSEMGKEDAKSVGPLGGGAGGYLVK